MSIFFSVVIPSYNRANLIPKTIDTVFAQTFQDFEIIVVDDGSTDGTDLILKQLYQDEPKFRYYKKENEERGRARNFGFEQSQGTYVVFFDSDDLMLPDYLETLKKGIDKYRPNFIATKFILTNATGEKVANGSSIYPSRKYDYKDFLNGNFLACHFAVRRLNPSLRLFEENRAYAILEDWMFLIENLHQDKLMLLDKIGVEMIVHDGRSMGENQIVIERRLKANETLLNRVNLSAEEQNLMTGNSYFFCAIHAFLDNRRKQSICFLKQSIQRIGLDARIMTLLFKNIIGQSMTFKITKLYKNIIR